MTKMNYKKRMQLKKEHIDSRIEAANIEKGVIVLMTGNGKGKSSSAIGMVSRALGYGMKIGIAKFLKGEQETGEDLFFKEQKNVQTVFMETGFTWESQDKDLDKIKALEAWKLTEEFLSDPTIDLVILDELTYMINYKYLDEEEIIKRLKSRPKKQHVVITGRAACKGLVDIADTVSEVKEIKHAFRSNIKAQRGIDF
ncbi:MAG: cob(I)yrinic acid a,c-diamide adenosyltransferase [Gammaproteobacteria bacterium]|nr:cob(I)yrinic acid a,c-diamide adenosyltransferase [Gammaproteobacteria bacterium]